MLLRPSVRPAPDGLAHRSLDKQSSGQSRTTVNWLVFNQKGTSSIFFIADIAKKVVAL
jgi:hypothetical protein